MKKVKDEKLRIKKLQLEYTNGENVSKSEQKRIRQLLKDCTELTPGAPTKGFIVLEKQNTYDFLVRGNYKAKLEVIEVYNGQSPNEALKHISMTDMLLLCEGGPDMSLEQLMNELPQVEFGYFAVLVNPELMGKLRFTMLYLPNNATVRFVNQKLFKKLFDPNWYELILEMIERNNISICDIQEYIHCTFPTAARIWDSLEMMGIISVINGHGLISVTKEDFLKLCSTLHHNNKKKKSLSKK